ncbi:MAG: carboxypeptidase-like regulatory domain-containing protein, partial [Maribacter dokdonensis]
MSAKVSPQEDTVAANFKNKNLGDIFETITNSTGHKFFYEATEVDLDRKVTVSKSPLRIAELLDEIFKGTDLEYEILSNQIVVKRKGETVYSGKIPEKSVEISNFQTSLNGNVLDEDGNPLPGASVVAKGTTVGTTTDFDGNFNITLPIGVTTVQVSYLGYRSKEVDVAGKETITISLEPDAAALEEVIVVGYGSLAKTKV